jgi:hypothetical protein
MKKKKFNVVALLSILLIIGGVGFTGISITSLIIKKMQSKKPVPTKILNSRIRTPSKKVPLTVESDINTDILRLSNDVLSFSPPSLDKIKEKTDTIGEIVKSVVSSLTSIGGVIILFLQIKKQKRSEDEAEEKEETETPSKTKYHRRKKVKATT